VKCSNRSAGVSVVSRAEHINRGGGIKKDGESRVGGFEGKRLSISTSASLTSVSASLLASNRASPVSATSSLAGGDDDDVVLQACGHVRNE
jgi:hypothetical protein